MTPPPREKDERNATIYWRYMRGDRAADLAREFGVGRERISQIVKGHWLRRRRLLRRRERDYLHALGLGFVYLAEREQQRGHVRTYRVRHDGMRVQEWF